MTLEARQPQTVETEKQPGSYTKEQVLRLNKLSAEKERFDRNDKGLNREHERTWLQAHQQLRTNYIDCLCSNLRHLAKKDLQFVICRT
jgi:hypothetical protein